MDIAGLVGRISLAVLLALAGLGALGVAFFGTVPLILDDYESSTGTRVGSSFLAGLLILTAVLLEVKPDKIDWSNKAVWAVVAFVPVALVLTAALTTAVGGTLHKSPPVNPSDLSAEQLDGDISAEIAEPVEEAADSCSKESDWIDRNPLVVSVKLSRSPRASWVWALTQTEQGIFPRVLLQPRVVDQSEGSWWNKFDTGKPYEEHHEKLLIVLAGPNPSRALQQQLFGGGLQQLPAGSRIIAEKGVCLR